MKKYVIILFLFLLCANSFAQTRGADNKTAPTFSKVTRQSHAYRTTGMNLTANAENAVVWETIDSSNTGFLTPSLVLYHAGRWICEIALQFKNTNIATAAIAGIKLRLNGTTIATSRCVWESPASSSQTLSKRFIIDVTDSDTSDAGRAMLGMYILTDQNNCTLYADSSSIPVSMHLYYDNTK